MQRYRPSLTIQRSLPSLEELLDDGFASLFPASQGFAPAVMANAAAAFEGLDAHQPQLLVSREAPHVVLQATPAWLHAAGYADAEVTGRPAALLLQGDGTCLATAGALWTALQVRFYADLFISSARPPSQLFSARLAAYPPPARGRRLRVTPLRSPPGR